MVSGAGESRKPTQAFTGEGPRPPPRSVKGLPGRGVSEGRACSLPGRWARIPTFVEASPRTQPLPLHRADRLRITGRTGEEGRSWASTPGRRGHRGAVLPQDAPASGQRGDHKGPFLLSPPGDESQESRPRPKSGRSKELQRRAAGRGAAPGSQPGRLLWPHPWPLRLGWHTGKLGQAGGLVCC